MRKRYVLLLVLLLPLMAFYAFKEVGIPAGYTDFYHQSRSDLERRFQQLKTAATHLQSSDTVAVTAFLKDLQEVRFCLKSFDFWGRYLEPVAYKSLNGPLPVEWETEVFEKWEKPYRRDGAGLSLAVQYLEEAKDDFSADSLAACLKPALSAMKVYAEDSITQQLQTHHSFFLSNRLHLLNLAAIYTTGFDCPDTTAIIPELLFMMQSVSRIYQQYQQSFPDYPLTTEYRQQYEAAIQFVATQPKQYSAFSHYRFLRDYVNPMYQLNQQMMHQYRVYSQNLIDYSLNKNARSIFSNNLYRAQNIKGIFLRVTDEKELEEIRTLGRQLFYDPILSANNERSCGSCHKPNQFFTDTNGYAAPSFGHDGFLNRNTPSLVGAPFQQLLTADGRHTTLQQQALGVIHDVTEMGGAKDGLQKVLSCPDYKKAFTKLLRFTPQEPEITEEHLTSALSLYYGNFSGHPAPFDEAMNRLTETSAEVQLGFNLFMSRAQCATCHFVPQFNGVKPPYQGSEFEVLGVPADPKYTKLSSDTGRYGAHPVAEMASAFRTNTVRNVAYTAPYMHNGVFRTLEEVLEFYNNGGGAGHGLTVKNQTLPADSLHLSAADKKALTAFMLSLTEKIPAESIPQKIPLSTRKALNQRRAGGVY